ncbi:MAG: sensor histidine kinase [Clostridiaceae bacterium]|nr:sensor histidine kinase [Clostridiaceae bacterium]
MDNKIKDVLVVINYILLTGIFLIITLFSDTNQLLILTLAFLFLTSYTIRVFFLYNSEGHKNLCYVSLILDIIFIFAINVNDISGISLCLYCFILEDLILNFNIPFGIITSFFSFVIYSFASALSMNFVFTASFTRILLSSPIFFIIYLIFFLIKYLLKQTEVIATALKDITIEKLEKDCVYSNLKGAYEKLELVTILKERNKIAGEIHDTVGHTLTTVLIEMEASKRLIKVDSDLAIEKLRLAQEQVRKGLNDLRSSVRILEKGEELLEFYPSLEALIKDTELHSGVTIKAEIDNSLNLDKETEKVVFSSLLEGLTNGMRHGKSTAFLFKLLRKENRIFFSLEDNGRGASTINLGFGLRAMRDRVYELKGSFDINAVPQEGLELIITLPYSLSN